MSESSALDAVSIAAANHAIGVEVHDCLDSTQSCARGRLQAGARRPLAIFAEAQTAGRGQRGRVWYSPPGAALYLTLIWPTARRMAGLAGLSLIVGLILRRVLAQFGVDAQLKWPNDVWVGERKLAGVLIELVGDPAGSTALIGIGLNHDLPDTARAQIDQPHIDLGCILDPLPSRNAIAAALLESLQTQLQRFEAQGLGAFLDEWDAADALRGRPIWLVEGQGRVRGMALGIDAVGRLRVQVDGRERLLTAGEVSIRADQDDPA